jgi:hypothetical protein
MTRTYDIERVAIPANDARRFSELLRAGNLSLSGVMALADLLDPPSAPTLRETCIDALHDMPSIEESVDIILNMSADAVGALPGTVDSGPAWVRRKAVIDLLRGTT